MFNYKRPISGFEIRDHPFWNKVPIIDGNNFIVSNRTSM